MDMMKMVLLDVSGTGMQHRLQGVGLRQELGYCSPPPLKSLILEKISYFTCYFRGMKCM